MRIRLLQFVPILFAGLGCESATALRNLGREIPVTATQASGEAPAIRNVTLDANGFTISGHINTPTPCYQLSAYRDDHGADVTITVVATSKGGYCAQVLGSYDYVVNTAGSCPVHLVIIHHYEGTSWPDARVFEDSWGCPVLNA